MGKKSGGEAEVTDYYMSMHQGFCWGPVDALLNIYVGDKECWSGEMTDLGAFGIDRTDLFGGNKKEGGVQGNVWFLPGKDDQQLGDGLASLLGRTNATCPGFRGLTSLFFIGSPTRGFMWSSNTPYLKPLAAKFRRSPKGLNAAYRMIGRQTSVAINGFSATVGEATGTLTNGVISTIGGHAVGVDYVEGNPSNGNRTVTVDGVDIVIAKSDGRFTVTVDQEERTNVRAGTTVSIYGMSITVGDTSTAVKFGTAGTDANAVHIIYECLTNTDWGMGASTSIINVASFEAAGQTVFNEGIGLSLGWYASMKIEDFIGEIIDHILATVFVNPADGLITIKLVRDDYDPDTLPVLTPDNCVVNSFDRKLWGETTNEIVVTWTNPANEGEESVTVQDLANIAIQGGIVSDSRNYYGVRNAELALQLALRDIRTASAPLASFDLSVDRSAWNFVPGGLVKLVYPEEGIDGVILRIGKIDYGKPGQPSIRVSAMEDIFGLPVGAYTVLEETKWQDTSAEPQPMEYVTLLTMPRYFAENTIDISEAEYPDVATVALAASSDPDTSGFTLYTVQPAPNGQGQPVDLGDRSVVGRAVLSQSIAADYKTSIDNTSLTNYTGPAYTGVNNFVLIGSGGDKGTEIALISEASETGIVLQRGILDTVPRNWPTGTQLLFFPGNLAIEDASIRAAGETAEYKILTQTSLGTLAFAEAPIESITLSERPWLPNRPGDVKVGGVAFGSVQMGNASTIPVTWANRNRLMEPTEVVKWSDGNVTPEDGQTTRITVMKMDGTVLTTHDGLSGTSFDLPASSFVGEAQGVVRVTAVRDGMESLQGHEIIVTLTSRGWGTSWGSFWGGDTGEPWVPIDPETPPPPPDPEPEDPWTQPPRPHDPWNPYEQEV